MSAILKAIKSLVVFVIILIITKALTKHGFHSLLGSSTFKNLFFSYSSKNEIKKLAEMNKSINAGFPKMIDKDTRIDSMQLEQGKISYLYTLVNHEVKKMDLSVFRSGLVTSVTKRVCELPEMRPLFKDGFILTYLYHDKNGKEVLRFIVKPKDCDITSEKTFLYKNNSTK